LINVELQIQQLVPNLTPIRQLANDTAGLLDALKIPKADVMGYSLGSYLGQQLAITHPD
jgi:pimeloyl-ACP methyl ester carboxylesterase